MSISIKSILDEDNTRQMLPDTRVMLNMIKPAWHIKIFLLLLHCKVNLNKGRKTRAYKIIRLLILYHKQCGKFQYNAVLKLAWLSYESRSHVNFKPQDFQE